MPVGRRSQTPEHLRLVEQHPARALDQGLDNNARQFAGAPLQEGVERRGAGLVAGQVEDGVLGQRALEQGVHALFRIAHRHRGEGVAVIAALEGEEFGAAALAPVQVELHGHLHGHLDRHRAGVGEEHPLERRSQQGAQPRRQAQGRLVRQPAEHHVRHDLKLAGHRIADVRMVVAVAGGPPRRCPIHQLAPVGQDDARPMREGDRQRRLCRLHLGVGQPDVRQALGVPGWRGLGHREGSSAEQRPRPSTSSG